MSKIEDLIRQYCPDGVEYVKLGDIEDRGLIKLGRGNVISKQDMKECPGDFPVYSSSSVGDGEIGRYGKYMFDDERISWSIDGGGKFFYRNNIKYSITNVSGWLKVLVPKLVSTKYLYYSLTNEWMNKVYDYTHKAHPSVIREEYEIPLPPLPVQKEIVRILDNFTNLAAELQAELQARQQQYNYYREKLFSQYKDFQRISLSSIFPFIRNGFVGTISTFFTDKENGIRYLEGTNIHNGIISDNVELYVNKEFHKKHIKNELKPDDILMVQSGHIGDCAVVGEKYRGSNCHALIILSNGGHVNSQFYVHYFHTFEGYNSLKPAITDGNLKHILAGKMHLVKVPQVDIEEQNRIVGILDKLEKYCTDLNQGLPAEIEARQQQYEYYRDQLLTFKRKEA